MVSLTLCEPSEYRAELGLVLSKCPTGKGAFTS